MKDSWITPTFSFRCGRVIIAGLLFCLASAGCGKNSSLPDADGSADFALTAEELEAEFRQDEKMAEGKYEGKTIELSGVVQSMYGDEPSFLGLYRGKGLLGLPCVMAEKEPRARVSFGQQVTVKGRWSNDVNNPALEDCVIVETGPNLTVRLSASQLAAEYGADPEGTKKKYVGKPLILSGEVVDDLNAEILKRLGNDTKDASLFLRILVELVQTILAGPNNFAVFLKGTDKVHIHFWLRSGYENRLAEMTKGKQVIIFAEANELSFFKNDINFSGALPITK